LRFAPAGPGSAPPATAAVLAARESLAALDSNPSIEAEELVFLLNQAERIRLSLLTLRRLGRRLVRDRCVRPGCSAGLVLSAVSATLERIVEIVEKSQPSGLAGGFTSSVNSFLARPWETASPWPRLPPWPRR